MTAKELRAKGFTVVFMYGEVFLSRKGEDLVYFAPIDGGRWMDESPFNCPTTFKTKARFDLPGYVKEQITAAEEYCYCSSLSGSTCDFCGSLRKV